MSEVLAISRPRISVHNLRVYKRVYTATPYTNFHAGRDAAAEAAATLCGRLNRNGVTAISPIVLGHWYSKHGDVNPHDLSIWHKLNDALAETCAALLVAEMEGWKESAGIAREIKIFEHDGKPIYYIEPNSLLIRSAV